jgi:hypothetical protein
LSDLLFNLFSTGIIMTQEQVSTSEVVANPVDIVQAAQVEGTEDIANTVNNTVTKNTLPAENIAPTENAPAYIYALGRIQAQFPSSSVQNLYDEVVFQKFGPDAKSKSLFEVLSMPEHLFLAKKMCWVLTIDAVDCYVLHAQTPSLLSAFIKALQPKSNQQFEYLVAHLGAYAADDQCAGRTIKIAYVHQIQSFTIDEYCQILSQQTGIELSKIKPLFNSMLKFCRNGGNLPTQRALNYVSLKCTALYKTFTAPMLAQNKEGIEFEQIEAITCSSESERQVMTLIFSYLNPQSKRVEKQHINIDVSEIYPFTCSELIYGAPQT